MTGTSRITDHNTFTDLQWRRNLLTPYSFTLPSGFHTVSHRLTDDFIEILEDIHAFQCIRDTYHSEGSDTLTIAQIDNQQASIQSRLAMMSTSSHFMDVLCLAAYLSSATLRCRIWHDSVIPVSMAWFTQSLFSFTLRRTICFDRVIATKLT